VGVAQKGLAVPELSLFALEIVLAFVFGSLGVLFSKWLAGRVAIQDAQLVTLQNEAKKNNAKFNADLTRMQNEDLDRLSKQLAAVRRELAQTRAELDQTKQVLREHEDLLRENGIYVPKIEEVLFSLPTPDELAGFISERFNRSELKQLVFEMGWKQEQFDSQGFIALVIEVVEFAENNDMLEVLYKLVKSKRPKVRF
jgi:hypothetical protein